MCTRVSAAAVGLLLMCCTLLRAEADELMFGEQRFAQLEPLPAPQLVSPPTMPPQTAFPAYPQAPVQQFSQPPAATFAPAAVNTVPTAAAVSQQELQVVPAEMIYRESPYRTHAWLIDLDLIPTFSEFTESEFGSWDDDGSLALRLTLGFEEAEGMGTKIRMWGFTQDVSTPAADIELGASTFNWDFYRRLYIEDAEVVLGGGPIGAYLEFEFPDIDEHSRFNGGGITAFGEGYFPLAHYRKTDIATIFRARLSVLRGEWRDSGTPFVPDSNHDSMTITEVAWGLELRRRFGRLEDKYWLIRLLPEYQRWDSAWMGEFADSNITFVGTNISFGLAW